MKLATFNMESFGFDRFEPQALEHRLLALRPKILELQADILCLQEVNAQKVKGQTKRQFPALNLLLEGTPYQHYHVATSERQPGLGPDNKHNLAILSRYPISHTSCLFQQHADPPYWRPRTAVPEYDQPQNVVFERPILGARIDIGTQKPLHLFTVHLRAPIAAMIRGAKRADRSWKSLSAWAEGYQLSVLKQTAQALELRLAVERLFDDDEEAQVILTGIQRHRRNRNPPLLRADPDDTGSPHLSPRRLFQLDRSLPRKNARQSFTGATGRPLTISSPAPR